MNDSQAWYNDDEFWKNCYPILFPEQKVLDGITQVNDTIKLLSLYSGINILDLCCGIGRHTLEFARRGYKITGIDRTQFYLDKIKKAAESEKLNINLIKADMRDDLGDDKYDLVLNFNTSLGYFESED
ncbi:MAG: class I SAM-dependent methyltransferase, partial [Candidatus Zixiibacteriota bacterium]